MATMASTFSLCSPILPPSIPFSGSKMQRRRSSSSMKTFSTKEEADHGQNDYYGKIVDDNLIILRKRIHEMKMIEGNYEATEEWMDWEKSFYTSYSSIICEVIGFLQSKLMNTRPSLALGMIVLIILSVPTSILVAVLRLIELSKGVLEGIHPG